jgi:hypothetical protein
MFISKKLFDKEEAKKAMPMPEAEIEVNIVPKEQLTRLQDINPDVFYFDLGDEYLLCPEGVYSDGTIRYLKDKGVNIVYSSSNPSIATVNQEGKIKAVSPGECEIYFKYSGVSGKITAKVAGKPGMVHHQFPIDGRINVSPSVKLIWGGYAKQHELYLWKAPDPKPATPIQIDYGNSYKPVGGLESNTTYYWQVVAKNPAGKTEGPVLKFTTSDKK